MYHLWKNNRKNGKNLCVHHVEYDKSACCHGKPIHFAAMCHRCHSKTNFDRERWEAMMHRIIDEIYDGRSYYTKDEYKIMLNRQIKENKDNYETLNNFNTKRCYDSNRTTNRK